MASKYELKKTSAKQFMWNLKAGNGEVILTSESYTAKAGALNGIESARKNAPNDASYERKTSSKQEPFFVLKAGNGETIGRSEMYSSTSAMEGGIASVKKNAPEARVDDLTG